MIYDLTPIGVVQSAVKDSQAMPLQGVPAAIKVFDEFVEGLSGIDGDSHINIIGWFSKAEKGTTQGEAAKNQSRALGAWRLLSSLAYTPESAFTFGHTLN